MDKDNITNTEQIRVIEALFRAFSNRASNNIKIDISLGERKQTGGYDVKDHSFISKVCVVLTKPKIYMRNKDRKYHNFEIWGNEGSQFTLVLADFKNINFRTKEGDTPNDFREINDIYLTTEFWGNEVDMNIKIEKE